ncbi:class II aldolase/adducin family protein [Actinokineospora enzanensis]|uniref:class II aldolase/adducin family protein n=1 Tax=Actinokineospora enzanensis TaxID=155975 RepID=UPI00037C7FEF|nr:class II aldolase/adducin family protein [Actinokineospora enzanensis]
MRTVAEERLRRKQRLAASLRLFHRYGFDEGAGGHLTVRDPEYPERFWVNPFGRSFGRLCVSDLILVDAGGEVVEGEGKVNPAGYVIHSRVHAARPDVVAAVHTHSVYGRAFAALGRRLDPLTQDSCAFYEDHGHYAGFGGVVLDAAEGERVAAALGPCKAVILQNHGLLTVGGSIEEAAWWFVSMESCCRVQLIAEAADKPVLIDPVEARGTRDVIGSPQLGRLNFRPLYEQIVHDQPDLLD